MAQLFDEMTRVVGSGLPRRRALKLIFKGLVGSAFFTLGLRSEPNALASPSPQAFGYCYTFSNCTGIVGALQTQIDCCGEPDEPCVNKSWRQQGTNTCTRCPQCRTGGNTSPSRPSSVEEA